ncbi:MAG: trypsin-like peptidase domain-containing protein [Myxococcota bacterium]
MRTSSSPPHHHHHHHQHHRSLRWGLALASAMTLGSVVGAAVGASAANAQSPAARERPSEAVATPMTSGALTPPERHTIGVFERASPAVVFITRLSDARLSLNATAQPSGTGSGFVWDDKGHVVTNYHVVKGGSGARVTLADRSTWKATLVGAAPDKDLAVLRIEAPAARLTPLPRGRSGALRVGQHVYAIGNPFGLDHTLSTGVISGLDRQIQSVSRRPITGAIQTDAAINPGNSGGPLLDSTGRLIGINTAIYSPSGASAGIGFAVPVDSVNRVVPELIQNGRYERPALGVSIADARRVDQSGVLIMDVTADSGAARAGLRGTRRDASSGAIELGDIIVGFQGRTVEDQGDLFAALDETSVGDRVILTVKRGGETRRVEVTLGAKK